jgi:hypothetical protein
VASRRKEQAIPAGDRTVYVDTAGSDFDTLLAVYRLPEGLPLTFANLVLIGGDDDSGPGNTSSFDLPFDIDDRLYFQVAGYEAAFGQLRFNVDVRPWIY